MPSDFGRILPSPDPIAGELPAASPRRLEVEAKRAARCAETRTILESLSGVVARAEKRVLEIGSGHGHYLAAYADEHPTHFCVGIDYCAERSRRAQRKQGRAKHGNIRFLRAEAGEFLQSIPSDVTFDRVFVLFPDPWPKRRHRKYRLMSDGFLTRLGAHCSVGAELCFRTDAAAYFADAVDVLSGHRDWHPVGLDRWPFEYVTVFQTKAPTHQSVVAVNGR